MGAAEPEVIYEPPPPTIRGTLGTGAILAIAYFAVLGFVLAFTGPGFLFTLWPAWLLLGAFGLVQLLLLLQRNRFGVYTSGIAPTYRPWKLWSPKRLIIAADRLERVQLIPIGGVQGERLAQPTYFQCVLELVDGTSIVIPSHGGYRSLRRQLRSDERVREAGTAIGHFGSALQGRKAG